ncbi:MAG: hypothetical protein HOP07_05620 [Bacteriovoracaceae bacterium]|nr:hypothetical protein [Bacteriovoracaceae bacterium]
MIFPIFEITENEIVSIKGDVSRFYKIETPDITQMTLIEVDSFYHSLKQEMRTLKEGYFYKIYYLNDNLYLNTNDFNPSFKSFKLISENNPLKQCLGEDVNFQDIEFFDDYYILGGQYFRLLNIYELPSLITGRFLEQFGDFILNIKKIDPVKAKSKLNLKRKMHFSLTLENLRNLESEKAFQESEELLEKIMTGEEAIFEMEGWIRVTAPSKAELDNKTIELKQMAKIQDLELLTEIRGLAYFFNNLTIGVKPTFKRSHLTPASYITGLLSLPTEYVMDEGIQFHSNNGRDVKFSLFHPHSTNFNLLITGASGEGKSMVANKILKEELKLNTKFIVLDLGHSFKRTVAYYDGVNFSDKFNPLSFQDPSYLKAFVLSVTGPDYFSKQDEGKLFEVLKLNESTKYNTFDQFLKTLEKEFKGISYFFSEVKYFFTDKVTKINDLTYCDLSLYPECIKAPLIIYLIEHFKYLEGKKIFIFDEVWGLLQNNAEYVAHSFRTFRKYFASAVAISQNLEDLLISELGRVIYQNSCHKFLFRQDVKEETLSTHTYELLNQVASDKGFYSEFLLLSDQIKKIVRFYSNPIEFEMFNTDNWELIKFQKFYEDRKEIMDFQEIFDHYIYLKHGEVA